MRAVIVRPICCCLVALLCIAPAIFADEPEHPIPPLAELETAGAVIGEIRINDQNIFDLDDPKDCLLYTSDAADE